MRKRRTAAHKAIDFLSFPIRAFTLFLDDRWKLSSLASERYDYVANRVRGYCLDVGCGRYNRLVNEYLEGYGCGIDVFPYEGLTKENIINDMSRLPFNDSTFDSVTFVANMNHIPRSLRDIEVMEAYRVLKKGGNVIVTMGNPLAEIIVHIVVRLYDKILNTDFDMDGQRGMGEDEEYYLRDSDIIGILGRAGFKRISKQYFLTQWGFNHLFVGWK